MIRLPYLRYTLQHNKQREALHRLQARHPEAAVKAALQSPGHQTTGVETAQETDSSDDEDEVRPWTSDLRKA